MLLDFKLYDKPLNKLPEEKIVINTINAHSYNVARQDVDFQNALLKSDVLLPDGISVVWAVRLLQYLKKKPVTTLQKIAGEDLFYFEMKRLSGKGTATALFLGSSETVLQKIKQRAANEFPAVNIETYSPPFKTAFSHEDNTEMVLRIQKIQPDTLFVGMTAPKQEKWVDWLIHESNLKLNSNCHICSIGAVFDFYAGTVNRAPRWLIKLGLEWFYRLAKEPRRMWRRYLIGNSKFIIAVFSEIFSGKPQKNNH